MDAEWPLIGRGQELERIRVGMRDPARRGVIVAGAPGLGKTRLAAESLRVAETLGFATARATATRAGRAIPFGAIAPLLPPEQTVPTDDRTAFLRRAAAAVAERGRSGGAARGDRGGLVLLIDDAHLLDDASATLVHQLAVTHAAFVLATVRAGETAPDPIVALWKDGVLDRLDLEGLSESAVGELLTAVLGGAVDAAATAELTRHCQGNVLFLRELVLGARQAGTLQDDGHIWRLTAPLSPSDRLVELVEARLADLAPEERALLEVVAIGEPLGRAELNAFGDPLLAERLERKSLIIGSANGRRLEIRLAHPIYGDVLRARIPPLRVASVSRTLAEVVDGWGARRREDILRVATWRLDGGGGRPDLMLEAASIARWRYDFGLAERLVTHALVAGGGFEAQFLAAQLAGLQGRADRAEALLSTIEPTTDDERGRVAISRLDNVAFHIGDIERGLQIATEAEAKLADAGWRHKIAGRRAALLLATTGSRAAAATAVPLLDAAEGPAFVWACQVAAHSLSRLGRLESAMDAARRGHEAHQGLTEPMQWYPLDWHPWVQLFNICEIHASAGELVQAETIATTQYQDALAERSVEAQAWFAWQLARILGQRGHVASGTRYGREAVALFTQLGRPQFRAYALAHSTPVFAASGQAAQAAEAVAEMEPLQVPGNLMMAPDMVLARAWAAIAGSDLPRARTLLRETADLAGAIGDHVVEAIALHDLCRIGHHRDGTDRLQELAGLVEGRLTAARAAHARALSADDPELMEATADEFADMGADLLGAEAASDAAVSWQRRGDPQRGSRAARLATVLTDRCEGAQTPALQPSTSRVTLTPAERQAALLAASGRTTKDIAAELHLSSRTVSNHLQRVYAKLGINSRAELAESLDTER